MIYTEVSVCVPGGAGGGWRDVLCSHVAALVASSYSSLELISLTGFRHAETALHTTCSITAEHEASEGERRREMLALLL